MIIITMIQEVCERCLMRLGSIIIQIVILMRIQMIIIITITIIIRMQATVNRIWVIKTKVLWVVLMQIIIHDIQLKLILMMQII